MLVSPNLYQSITRVIAERNTRVVSPLQNNPEHNINIALAYIEGQNQAQDLVDSAEDIFRKNSSKINPENDILLFSETERIKKPSAEFEYVVKFSNIEDRTIKVVNTSNPTFWHTNFWKTEEASRVHNRQVNSKGQHSFPAPMSYYFFLHGFIESRLSKERQTESLTPITQNLIASLGVYSALNYANLYSGGGLDSLTLHHYFKEKGVYDAIKNKSYKALQWINSKITYPLLKPESLQFSTLHKDLSKISSFNLSGSTLAPPRNTGLQQSIKFISRLDKGLNIASLISSAINVSNAEN